MLIYSNGLFKLYNLFMTKYTNALFITHREISEDFKQVDMAMINQCDDDRVFFNLGECSGTLEMIRTMKGIALAHEFERYILCIDRNKGIQWWDFFIRKIFLMQGVPLTVYLPPVRSYDFTELLLRKHFLKGVQVVVQNGNDLNMVRRYAGGEMINLV